MIVHSTRNLGTATCEVRVEWADDDRAHTDTGVALFAMGAAAKQNPGYDTTAARVVGYTLDGQDVRPDEDEYGDANGAVVEVILEELAS